MPSRTILKCSFFQNPHHKPDHAEDPEDHSSSTEKIADNQQAAVKSSKDRHYVLFRAYRQAQNDKPLHNEQHRERRCGRRQSTTAASTTIEG